MKAVVSTVSHARVSVDGSTVGEVHGPALLVLLGVGTDDAPDAWELLARKVADLRLFPAPNEGWEGRRDLSAEEVGASVLLVSQFTLMGETKKGRRPSWAQAAPGPEAAVVIEKVVDRLRQRGLHVETGEFGAMMAVESVNEGPFTVLVEA
ncbi:MAG TPA: D-tyrosyl-tRNA(Tyr) deacylase [Candidatus Corynebacterium gallistercoris]|uniref:D-aminoacyl-tRNA deacylase n=1 Tax=Candidatus Corynebacterium gallistercoris TaxID=2838530 RepID=A0A9D1UPC6_9CORY|nr:D-tyrosyl-tRNA(Tyr) deacylase [Candidatus Corynebacterium gallistercoris]